MFSAALCRAEDAEEPVDAFRRPLGALSAAEARQFQVGRRLFGADWAIAPGPPPGPDGIALDGLGPLFSRLSCDGCHTRAGRGSPPQAPEYPMIAMTVRLSVPGMAPDGGPRPHPRYGEVLDRNAVAGVPIEGYGLVSYTETPGHYADGAPYSLRTPRYRFEALAFGPLGPEAMFSARVAPALIGLGLLDAVSDATLKSLVDAEAREGKVRGRVNLVWDVAAGAPRIGRFGWKAGQPHLRQQNANAFNRDIGITNPLYRENDCTAVETACQTEAAAAPRHPKIDDALLDAVTLYVARLAPPPSRDLDTAQARRGAALFAEAGCAACHRPSLQTGDNADATLARRMIHPYTDLLLHDMGEGLADNRPEFAAGGRDWRTAPLWGLGLIPRVNDHTTLLHDGRARGPAEAILWHGGEAESAKEAFRRMSKGDRDALIAFLEAL